MESVVFVDKDECGGELLNMSKLSYSMCIGAEPRSKIIWNAFTSIVDICSNTEE